MAAARDGYTALVKILMAAGADHWQVDEFGRTADSLAEEKGFAETQVRLIDRYRRYAYYSCDAMMRIASHAADVWVFWWCWCCYCRWR